MPSVSPDSSLNKVTSYRLEERGSTSRRGRDFSPCRNPQTDCGEHPASYPTSTGESIPAGKVAQNETDHSTRFGAEINSVYPCLSLSLHTHTHTHTPQWYFFQMQVQIYFTLHFINEQKGEHIKQTGSGNALSLCEIIRFISNLI
jgi:hypothetical protein